MKPYIVSLALGLLVGIIYALFNVRSPAPPVIALVGLLGILLGEQVPPLVKRLWTNEPAAVSLTHQVGAHVFGHMSSGQPPAAPPAPAGTINPSSNIKEV